MDKAQYCRAFEDVKVDFEDSVAQFGLPFEADESCPRTRRDEIAAQCLSVRCENGNASLRRGWISPACLACRKGERTATFFVSLKCTRNCYFCFNPNQEDYDFFRSHTRDIASELRDAHAQGAVFDCLAVTGGEPCLHKPEVLDFLRCAKELYPNVHVRIYTSGDLLDDAFLAELADAGLDELRFSVKPQETDGEQEALFERMGAAVRILPDVMVEMPVMPGRSEEMRDLLVRLDGLGIRGINLLELCFPLHNEREFQKRGFELRRNPYKVLYNYWYAGGLPIAGSEAACLDLLRFAEEKSLSMGVHYCSLDNKNTGQVFQQNRGFLLDDGFARSHAWLDMDRSDYFLKCLKAFGDDVRRMREWVESPEGAAAIRAASVHAAAELASQSHGGPEPAHRVDSIADMAFDESFGVDRYPCLEGVYGRIARLNKDVEGLIASREAFLRSLDVGERMFSNEGESWVAFPSEWLGAVRNRFPEMEFATCWHAVEFDEGSGPMLREVFAE